MRPTGRLHLGHLVGALGNGDSFVARDPSGIRPCHWFENDEVVAFASERAPLCTVFDLDATQVHEVEPGRFRVDVPDGWSLMQAAIANGVDGIVGECGGSCACATCHCYVDESRMADLPPASEAELEKRAAAWTPPKPHYTSGVMAKYAKLVTSAAEGAVTKV